MTPELTLGGLRFPPPKPFTGKEDEFETFAHKLRAFLSLQNPRFRQALKNAQESTEPIDYDLLDEPEQIMAVQLQHVLTSLTEGPAHKVVMKDDYYDNGLESWRQLWLRYGPTKRSRATGRMTSILQWKFRENQFETDLRIGKQS